eukprot:4223218-Pyramimonas_sp.AAC.1
MATGSAHEELSGRLQPVPPVSDLVGGFPCPDASALNNKQDRNTVRDRSLRTGCVFHAILDIVVAGIEDRPDSIILENVLGLLSKDKESNCSSFDWCVYYLKEIGYETIAFKLNSQDFAWPVQRGRVWFICINADLLKAAGMSPGDVNDIATDLMSRLVVPHDCKRNLDEFLLPEDDPAILDMTKEWSNKRSIQQARYRDACSNG